MKKITVGTVVAWQVLHSGRQNPPMNIGVIVFENADTYDVAKGGLTVEDVAQNAGFYDVSSVAKDSVTRVENSTVKVLLRT